MAGFSKTREIIQRGDRASQPAATAVQVGSLYFVTDELTIERSTGSAWESFALKAGDSPTFVALTLSASTGLAIKSVFSAHLHKLAFTDSGAAAARTITINVGSQGANIIVSGVNPSITLNNWFDQSVKSAATPVFASLILNNSPFNVNTFDITVSGICTLNDWFDQSVKVAATPVFTAGAIGGTAYATTALNGSTFTPDLLLLRSAVSNFLELRAHGDSAAAETGYIHLHRARGTVSSRTIVLDDDYLGSINFAGFDGTDYALGAIIRAEVDGAPGAGDMPTRLSFHVSADGSEAPAEAIRILSDKTLVVNGKTTFIGDNVTFWSNTLGILDTDQSHVLTLTPGSNLTANRVLTITTGDSAQTLDLGAWTAYTPTWGSSGTAPAIGNGTISGQWVRHGDLIFFRVKIVMGSTTTYGTGAWTFTVPVTSTGAGGNTVRTVGTVLGYDSGAAAFYNGVLRMSSGTTVNLQLGDAAGLTSNVIPITWATSDQIGMSGFYEAA